jgi:hypothetical protein
MNIAVIFQNPLAIMWTERFAVTWCASNEMALGRFPGECLNSTVRGCTMPAFSFEKISPPARRTAAPAANKKQRGVIVQMLDRLAEARAKRSLRKSTSKGTSSKKEA